MSGILLGVYRPFFTSPGIPSIDFPVGRISTNQLSIAVAAGSPPILALSSTSVTIGTGTKTFTINTALSIFTATDNITLASTANNSNFMTGTVTSLVGTTLTLNIASVGGSGTFSDWECILHLPAQCAYDGAQVAIRTGSGTADFSITDWQFSSIPAVFFIQNNHKVTFSQCLFDWNAFIYLTPPTGPYIARRSASGGGEPTFSMDHCTMDGTGSNSGLTCLGSNLASVTYCYFLNVPTDWWDQAPAATGIDTLIAYNRVVVSSMASPSSGVHSDCIQMVQYASENSFYIHHNWFTLPNSQPSGGSIVNTTLTLNTNTNTWNTILNIDNCIFEGGGYTAQLIQGPNAANAAINLGANIYFGKWLFGPINPGGTKSITGATQANPVVLTASNHGYANNVAIVIYGVNGMTQLNGVKCLTAGVTTNTLQLAGVDGTAFSAYTSGGSFVVRYYDQLTIAGIKNSVDGSMVSFTNPSNGQTVTSYP